MIIYPVYRVCLAQVTDAPLPPQSKFLHVRDVYCEFSGSVHSTPESFMIRNRRSGSDLTHLPMLPLSLVDWLLS